MSSTNQDASLFRPKGDDVTRSTEVARLCVVINEDRGSKRPVSSRDTSCCSVNRIDRLRHGGAVTSGVLLGHHWNSQLSKALRCGGNERNTASMPNHEVHDLRGARLGGNHKVPFVLAIGVIDHDNHLALLQFFQGFGDGGKHAHTYSLRRRGHLSSGPVSAVG